MKEYSIDRIVDSVAVLIDDDGQVTELSTELLPEGAKEGDILLSDGTSYQREHEKTVTHKEEVASLIDSLFR